MNSNLWAAGFGIGLAGGYLLTTFLTSPGWVILILGFALNMPYTMEVTA